MGRRLHPPRLYLPLLLAGAFVWFRALGATSGEAAAVVGGVLGLLGVVALLAGIEARQERRAGEVRHGRSIGRGEGA